MNDIRLIRKLSGAPGHARSALGASSTKPRRVPALGPEWWTQGWNESTRPIDRRCQDLCAELERSFGIVDAEGNPLGEPFAEMHLGVELPLELQQALLSIPDRFAHDGEPVVLRKITDGATHGVRVCAEDGQVIGMVEPDDLFRIEYWLEWAAYWLFACLGAGPDALSKTLASRLP